MVEDDVARGPGGQSYVVVDPATIQRRKKRIFVVGAALVIFPGSLVQFVVTGLVFRTMVCARWERRGITDCGGNAGFSVPFSLALTATFLLVFAELALLWWRYASHKRRVQV
jgi:hypothetical protein